MAGMDEFYGGASAVMNRMPAMPQQSSESAGLSTPTKRRMLRDPNPSTTDVDRYFGVGLGLAGLICENVVSHPFIVLRRQCQVETNVGRGDCYRRQEHRNVYNFSRGIIGHFRRRST